MAEWNLVVPLPQSGKKVTAVTAPNNIASGIFEREQQDFGFIDYIGETRFVITPYISENASRSAKQHNPSVRRYSKRRSECDTAKC
jgi:hypothetical protein